MKAVLLRLFLRRLLDNDLVSPHADRHESLAVLYAFVLSLGVFATFFISTNYLAAFIQLPGPAALEALSDRFLFLAASTAISALAALMVWEALSLERRDADILGPLPIAGRTLTHAKLAAVTIFGAVLTIALNAVPSVLYPLFLTLNIRGTRGATILRLIGAHAATVTMAGLFGFFGILAVRGILRILIGERVFRRMSSGVQSALVVGTVTALLLAPTVRNRELRNWVNGTDAASWPVHPVLWYLGVNEVLAGHLVAETPIVMPPRFSGVGFPTAGDRAARGIYRDLLPHFVVLARRGWLSFPLISALALASFLWTNRRLPDRWAGVPARSRLRTGVRRVAERLTQRDPEAQAGFFFALQTLTRSAPHRTILAVAMAVGLTHALIVLTRNGGPFATIQSTPAGVLGIAIMLLLSLLAGVGYAVTVPAAPGANWAIRMAWLGDERRYLTGVKRTGMLLASLLLLLLLPLHVALLGWDIAVAHSFAGLIFGAVTLDALLLRYRKLPFACAYVPIENPKLAWPAAAAGLLIVTYGAAGMERWALGSAPRAIASGIALLAAARLVRAIDSDRRRERRPIDFDDRPAAATQRLGLFDHIAAHD
jgi:hypothetical protein